jgi:hypothetical protein
MNAATTTHPTTLASTTNTYNHSHTATYGTDGIGVSLLHTHNSAGASGHFHNTTADKGNHSHGGSTGNAGAAHTHNLGYKMETSNKQQALAIMMDTNMGLLMLYQTILITQQTKVLIILILLPRIRP